MTGSYSVSGAGLDSALTINEFSRAAAKENSVIVRALSQGRLSVRIRVRLRGRDRRINPDPDPVPVPESNLDADPGSDPGPGPDIYPEPGP